jgi:hypothetical protein
MFDELYNKFEKLFKKLDNSKIFLAIVFIIHSIGAKYIEQQLSVGIKDLLKNPWAKSILIFCGVFIITKDCKVSIATAGIGFIIFRFLLQDDSYFCIAPKSNKGE